MNLEEHAKNAEDLARGLKNETKKDAAMLTMTMVDGELTFVAGGDTSTLIEGLAQAINSGTGVNQLLSSAQSLAKRLKESDKDDCNCTACKLRRILEGAARRN